jgi:hypothetical protein
MVVAPNGPSKITESCPQVCRSGRQCHYQNYPHGCTALCIRFQRWNQYVFVLAVFSVDEIGWLVDWLSLIWNVLHLTFFVLASLLLLLFFPKPLLLVRAWNAKTGAELFMLTGFHDDHAKETTGMGGTATLYTAVWNDATALVTAQGQAITIHQFNIDTPTDFDLDMPEYRRRRPSSVL